MNQDFFLGFASGIFFTIGTLVVVPRIFPTFPQVLHGALPVPEFPTDTTDLTVYGRTDFNWSLKTPDGRTVLASEFKDKVLFVNIWATSCPPCLMEFPAIQRLYNSVKNSDVVVLLIAMDEPEAVRSFLAEHDYDMPFYLVDGRLPEAFDAPGIPMTFITRRDGSIVFEYVGAARWDTPACRDFLESIL